MRKRAGVATLVMLAAAIWIIIDSRQIADTGIGNGAAILWDNEFEAFVSSLSANCENDMEKVTVYREWVIENISYDYACETLFYQTFDVKTVLQKRKGVAFDYACLLWLCAVHKAFRAMCLTAHIAQITHFGMRGTVFMQRVSGGALTQQEIVSQETKAAKKWDLFRLERTRKRKTNIS